MKSYRDGSINDDECDCHRDEAKDSDQLVASDFSLEDDGNRHYVVGQSDQVVVFAASLFSDRLAHNLFTLRAEVNVETDENVDENDDSDSLLESQD